MPAARPTWCTALIRVAVAGVCVLLPLSILSRLASGFPFELLSHFQSQYLLASLACLAVLGGLRRYRLAAGALVCVVASGTAVLPFVAGPGSRAHAAAGGGADLRLLLLNVLKPNRHDGPVLDLVAGTDADVLVFVEVDAWWKRALEALAPDYPHCVFRPLDNNFGLAVFSRIPFDDTDVCVLGDAGRASACLRITVGGTPVSVMATHPCPPVTAQSFRLRNNQLEQVAAYLDTRGPAILIGDINTTMWSPWYRRIERRTGMVNARLGHGVLPSWPTFLPAAARIPIDQCLVTPDITVTGCRLGPPVGSDHLPLIVDVSVPAS